MEFQYTFIVVSKITNLAKIINGIDKFHAVNKALIYYPDHKPSDLKILKKLSDAKKN
jgi:hypothetical protein